MRGSQPADLATPTRDIEGRVSELERAIRQPVTMDLRQVRDVDTFNVTEGQAPVYSRGSGTYKPKSVILAPTTAPASDGVYLISDSAAPTGQRWTLSSEMVITGGKVGIGGTPSYLLHVKASDPGNNIAEIRNTSATGFGLLIRNGLDTNYALSVINAAGFATTVGIYGNGNAFLAGNIGLGVSGNTEKLTIVGGATAGIRVDVNTGVKGFSMASTGLFQIDSAGVFGGRLSVLDNGNVGIGVAAPGGKLSITGSDAAASTTYLSMGDRRIRFKQSSGDQTDAGAVDYRGFDSAALSLVGAGTSSTNRAVRIYDRLGIGITPTVELDVNGAIIASSFRAPRTGTNYISTGVSSGGSNAFLILSPNGSPDQSAGLLARDNSHFTGGQEVILYSPVKTNGQGNAVLELEGGRTGQTAGAVFRFYNDLDTSGFYGATANPSEFAQIFLSSNNRAGSTVSDAHMLIYNRASGGTDRVSLALQSNGAAVQLEVVDTSSALEVRDTASNFVAVLASAFTVSSTPEFKTDVAPATKTGWLARLGELSPTSFKRPMSGPADVLAKDGSVLEARPRTGDEANSAVDRIGYMADDMFAVLPEAVTLDHEGLPIGIDYAVVAAATLAGLLELAGQVALLKGS